MGDGIVAKKKRRRSRYRFSGIPNLTEGLRESTRGPSRELAPGTLPLSDNHTGPSLPTSTDQDGFRVHSTFGSHPPAFDQHAPHSQSAAQGQTSSSGIAVAEDGLELSVLRETLMDAQPAEGSSSEELMDHDLSTDEAEQDRTPISATRELGGVVSLRISNWRVLWALLRTNGSHKLTKTNYQSVRNFVGTILRLRTSSWREDDFELHDSRGEQISGLPHFSTLHKNYRRILMGELVPRSIERLTDLDLSKAGARATPLSQHGTPKCKVRTMLPSEYARADISTLPVWEQLKSTTLEAHRQQEASTFPRASVSSAKCVDIWPIIAARQWLYGRQSALHLDTEGVANKISTFAEAGDVLSVTLLNAPSVFDERFQRCFILNCSSSQYKSIQGSIVHTWTVHHCTRTDDLSFQDDTDTSLGERDKQIVARFNFVTYTSPSDSIHTVIPDLPVHPRDPEEESTGAENHNTTGSRVQSQESHEIAEALKKRRAAMRDRKLEMEAAWRDWVKPIIKPGDFITMIRPRSPDNEFENHHGRPSEPTLLTAVDQASRILLVSRFWVENEERIFHIFWVSGSTELELASAHFETQHSRLRSYCTPLSPSDHASIMVDVRDFHLVTTHDGLRGAARFDPVSSIGTLATGEDYFVYRFALYWDGFEVQTGKSATGEGFYLLCLNLPLDARSSPSAVRVLSLTPPGVSPGKGLDSIFDDVIQGMTSRFADYDAEGRKRRMFLDLVAFLGDTPPLNSFLDVLGHNSNACCHLCRFTRGSTSLIGSRYAVGHTHGMVSHAMRTYFQHIAVRDCEAQAETCRLLGMKRNIASTTSLINFLRQRMFNARQSIPVTSAGHPVVPHVIDPYRACLIAPDHLLTGHLRDCISLALKLLPSEYYRTSCEKFMMGFLEGASLPVQNRLVDHSKKSLFSMSMTELYALSVVAHSALSTGCRYASETANDPKPLSAKCEEALRLVRSCSKLISEVWYLPHLNRDGPHSVQIFERNDGNSNMYRLQDLVDAHLAKVADICKMTDEDVLQLEDSRCPKRRKVELSKIMRETLISIKTVDKPNVHRLRELVHSTLPLVGHVGRIGELVLEKAHQTLKRSIKLSNNKEIQIHAMSGAAFSDWQGRLSMLAPLAKTGDEHAIRGCFRLLAGRDAISALDGELSSILSAEVLQTLGPEQCITTELQSQGRSVRSPRADRH